jgi:EpsI family protein
VLALAVPLALVRLRSAWRRVLIVIASLAIAALGNGVRVALIGLLAYYEIGSPLHGPFHVLHGLFVAGVGYVALFVGLHLLERGDAPASLGGDDPSRVTLTPRPAHVWLLALMFWTSVLVGAAPGATPVALAEPLDRIPARLGAWFAADGAEHVGLEGSDPWSTADQRFTRHYRRLDGKAAVVDVRYFEAQRQQHEMVSFLVADLHRHARPRQISLANGGVFTANFLKHADRDESVLFWYEVGGRAEADRYSAKLRSAWSAISSGRSNGAAVMVRARRLTAADLPAFEDLAAQVHAALGRHWPAAPATAR